MKNQLKLILPALLLLTGCGANGASSLQSQTTGNDHDRTVEFESPISQNFVPYSLQTQIGYIEEATSQNLLAPLINEAKQELRSGEALKIASFGSSHGSNGTHVEIRYICVGTTERQCGQSYLLYRRPTGPSAPYDIVDSSYSRDFVMPGQVEQWWVSPAINDSQLLSELKLMNDNLKKIWGDAGYVSRVKKLKEKMEPNTSLMVDTFGEKITAGKTSALIYYSLYKYGTKNKPAGAHSVIEKNGKLSITEKKTAKRQGYLVPREVQLNSYQALTHTDQINPVLGHVLNNLLKDDVKKLRDDAGQSVALNVTKYALTPLVNDQVKGWVEVAAITLSPSSEKKYARIDFIVDDYFGSSIVTSKKITIYP